jgi:enterochelin esterase-like enzyme
MPARLAAALLALVTFAGHAERTYCQTLPQPRPSGAIYERITVYGAALAGNLEGDSPARNVSVYLPPSYAAAPWRRYPVLYLLHGFNDSDDFWFGLRGPHFVNVPDAADRAFANGAAEMIIVMPDAYTRWHGSMYSSSVNTGDWETFIARDLVWYIDTHYRTIPLRASRGLAGHSMGGYGTMRIGMKAPRTFSSLYAMSPCCMPPNLTPNPANQKLAADVQDDLQFRDAPLVVQSVIAFAAAWSPNPLEALPMNFDLPIENGIQRPEIIARWTANAPLTMLHQYLPALKSMKAIAIDAGDRDRPISDNVQTLDQTLQSYGIAHTMEIYSGDHIDQIGLRLETHVLPFFSTHLSRW